MILQNPNKIPSQTLSRNKVHPLSMSLFSSMPNRSRLQTARIIPSPASISQVLSDRYTLFRQNGWYLIIYLGRIMLKQV
jgi:hypothetical protein